MAERPRHRSPHQSWLKRPWRGHLRPSGAWLLAGLLALANTASTGAPAPSNLLPEGAIAPSATQRQLAPQIAGILEQNHYRHIAIDDKLSPQVLERFLKSLDPQHSYLLASDVTGFDRWRASFGDMIHTGNVDPAYYIFNVFQQRNRERIRYALKLLDTEPDLSRDESFSFDREHTPWPATVAEMNELWRLRVKNDAITLMLTGKQWPDVQDLLRKRYQRVLERIDKVNTDDVFEALMNAYAATFDPHSNYFSPRSSEEYRIQMSLSYEGIGASLELNDDYVLVKSVLAGGPAATDGTLKPNDRITGVGQGHEGPVTDVIGWRLDDVVQLIRGKVGTIVRLQILPAGAVPGTPERTLELTRNKVTLEAQAAKKEIRQIQDGGRTYKVGIITVPGFYNDMDGHAAGDENYRSTTRDVRKLVAEMAAAGGVDALVLDLRGDGGGYLPEAIGLTGLFIDRGPVVQLKETTGQVEVLNDTDPGVAYSGPLAVLVDRTSASASEIFAAAIQDYHRGLILGQTTFGKGTVQSVIPLTLNRWSPKNTEGQLTVTIGKFYRVTGESTQLRGVTPDITLPSAISTDDVGESILEHALPWDRIATAPFRALNADSGLVLTLVHDQDQRSLHDADYQWLLAGIATLDSTRKEKTLSLNFKQRQQQRTTQNQEQITQENARRSVDGLPPIKSVEDINTGEEPDVVLTQAAHIMTDFVVVQNARTGNQPTLAQRNSTR
jgi:carboxyl-terminal processing protease